MSQAPGWAIPPRVVIAAAVLVVVQVGLIASLHRHPQQAWNLLGSLAVFAALAWWVRRAVDRLPLWFIGLVAVAVQIPGLLAHPLTSDDAYRYVWDARVQLAGIDPYHYPPLDPALTPLRIPELFPPGQPPLINRPTVPTIYPPIGQLWFLGIGLLTPLRLGTLGVQIGAAAVVVVTTVLLARLLGRLPGGHRGRALLYGACPLVAVETGNGGHLDALTALAILGFAWAISQDRVRSAGLAWGAAVGIKLVPVLFLPVLFTRARWRIAAVGLGLVGLAYLPHLIAVGPRVIGFLPGYLQEEGYQAGGRFALLFWLPTSARTPVALAVAAGVALLAFRRAHREPAVVTACWLYGCSLLIATPIYPWYVLPPMVLALVAGRLEWLALWPAAYLSFVFPWNPPVQALGYAAAGLVVCAAALIRRRAAAVNSARAAGAAAAGLSIDRR